MKKAKVQTPSKSRKKRFVIYGRIEAPSGRHIEKWHGEARSMATAMRMAVTAIWERPTVRWKHLTSVTLTATQDARGGAKAA